MATAGLLCLALAACSGGHRAANAGGSSGADAAFARYLEADARPSDPSIHEEFGRGPLPADFPAGLPVPSNATLLGWARTTSSSARSWQAIYTVAADPNQVAGELQDRLARGGWQVQDRASLHGFQSLDIAGTGSNANRTGVISVGPASGGGTQVIEETGEGG